MGGLHHVIHVGFDRGVLNYVDKNRLQMAIIFGFLNRSLMVPILRVNYRNRVMCGFLLVFSSRHHIIEQKLA